MVLPIMACLVSQPLGDGSRWCVKDISKCPDASRVEHHPILALEKSQEQAVVIPITCSTAMHESLGGVVYIDIDIDKRSIHKAGYLTYNHAGFSSGGDMPNR